MKTCARWKYLGDGGPLIEPSTFGAHGHKFMTASGQVAGDLDMGEVQLH